MTEQESMEYINVVFDEHFGDGCVSNTNKFAMAKDMAIKALEKQIPKKLTNIRKVKQYDGYDMGYCPICNEPLDNSLNEDLKYCPNCGQAIKWE